jgi:erythronate-4-phosphate dehydrogenase
MKIVADVNIPFVKECFSSAGQVETIAGREMSAKTIVEADALLVRSVTNVNERLLAGSKVKFVGTATIGFEHIDVDYLEKNNIGFASAPGSNANSVSEYVVAALLETGRKYEFDLDGKSIGIVGVGNVGSRVEKKCCALGMIPVLNDPPLKRQIGDKKYRPLKELFDCDFITLHTPLTYEGQDKTFHLADENFFNSLKDDVVFINTSRGGVVSTNALKRAIKSKKIMATILDVWENEPDIDTELLDMVDIGTPHIAGYSYDGKIAGMIMIYEAFCKHFGFGQKHIIDDFLPVPMKPEINLKVKGYSSQQLIWSAVGEIYDITKDDKGLRRILDLPLGKRCATFDRLRKEYPVRREFRNTRILLSPSCSNDLIKKLTGIGFKEVVPGYSAR